MLYVCVCLKEERFILVHGFSPLFLFLDRKIALTYILDSYKNKKIIQNQKDNTQWDITINIYLVCVSKLSVVQPIQAVLFSDSCLPLSVCRQ
jgi:hypothetical protein